MDYRKVIAIIRHDKLPEVESRLKAMRVPGITVTKVSGFGEYTDFFAKGWKTEHMRLEIFVRRDQADAIAEAIVESAHAGVPGDGLVAILPVEKLWRIRTGALATPEEFKAGA
jgi:nitrogen regulatory protein P-II 1